LLGGNDHLGWRMETLMFDVRYLVLSVE
jgi:hypothetical protein